MNPTKVCIVNCTAHKRDIPMRAEQLYCSELFYKSRRYAQAKFDVWLILSAKHGLVKPCDIVAPYDCNLASLTKSERKSLAVRISQQTATIFQGASAEITSICGEEYDHLLDEAGISFYRKPEFILPIGKKLQALTSATDPQKSEKFLNATYMIVRRLAKRFGWRRLRDVLEDKMPNSGVYLFFEEEETRLKEINQLRIVRIGTHGVAAGSKASL